MNVHDPHYVEELDYGFRWGPVTVERWFVHDRSGVLLGISTDYRKIQLSASPQGRSVRVWIDGVRYVPETGEN